MRSVKVARIVGVLPGGSSCPLLVDTESGRVVLKLVHGPEGPRALAAEWICAQMATAIGLPTPELLVLDLDARLSSSIADPELREAVERGSGRCLGLRELPSARPANRLDLETAPDEFAVPLLWLDTWVENPDRRWNNPNVLAWGASLVPIDHGSALGFHHAWKVTEQCPTRNLGCPLGHLYADRETRVPAWHPRLRALVPRDRIDDVCASVPDEWLGPLAFATALRQKLAYAAFLWKRLRGLHVEDGHHAHPVSTTRKILFESER
jgi:hypothetical protein